MPKIKIHKIDTNKSTPPGEYSSCVLLVMLVPRILAKIIETESLVSHALSGATVRVMIKMAMISRYGEKARMTENFGTVVLADSVMANSLTHSFSQLSRGPKSKVSLGIKKPRLAAGMTNDKPTTAPTMDGSSGPINLAVKA